jgi:hypothetical protein
LVVNIPACQDVGWDKLGGTLWVASTGPPTGQRRPRGLRPTLMPLSIHALAILSSLLLAQNVVVSSRPTTIGCGLSWRAAIYRSFRLAASAAFRSPLAGVSGRAALRALVLRFSTTRRVAATGIQPWAPAHGTSRDGDPKPRSGDGVSSEFSAAATRLGPHFPRIPWAWRPPLNPFAPPGNAVNDFTPKKMLVAATSGPCARRVVIEWLTRDRHVNLAPTELVSVERMTGPATQSCFPPE